MELIQKYQKLIISIAAISILLLFLALVIVSRIIGEQVKTQCEAAQARYPGDCVAALVILLDDENNTFRIRNSAIWTLGQLGDSRALPVLEKYYTGVIPKREPLDQNISQYELRKAINLLKDSFNITHLFWKR